MDLLKELYNRRNPEPNPHCCSSHLPLLVEMITLRKTVGRIVFLALFSYFLWRVVFSAERLFEDKIGSTKTKLYSKWRLLPSLSICFYKPNVTQESLLVDIDGNLQKVLDDVPIYFTHNNVSETG